MNDSGAFIVKFEFEFFEVTQGMADTFVIFFFDVKEQKAPSSSPKQFAAGSAVLHGEVIIPVDQLVGDTAGVLFYTSSPDEECLPSHQYYYAGVLPSAYRPA